MRMAMLAAIALLPTAAGCGSGTGNVPEPVPVSGTVKLDGKPLANAMVIFTPLGDNMGSGSAGTTDANGKYELSTQFGSESKKGAVPGNYRVHFSLMVGADGKPVVLDPETPPAETGAREALPPHLSDPAETEQKAEVSASGGTIDFKLSRKRGGGAGGLMPR